MARIVSKKMGLNRKATSETRKRRAGALMAAVAGVGLFAAGHSYAASGTWLGNNNGQPGPSYDYMSAYTGDWFSSSNWKNSTIANGGSSAIADFSTLDIPFDGSSGWFDPNTGLRKTANIWMYAGQTATVSVLHVGLVNDNGSMYVFQGTDTGTGTLKLINTRTITVDNSTAQVGYVIDNDAYNTSDPTGTQYYGVTGLVKEGAGTLILSSGNTYRGDTIINGGTLVVAGQGQLGGTKNALSNVVLNYGGQINFTSDSSGLANTFVVNGTGSSIGATALMDYSQYGGYVGGDPADVQLGTGWNATSKMFTSGSITGPGTLNIGGNGRIWLGVSANTGGGVALNSGVLALVEDNKISASSPLTINGGWLELHADGLYKDNSYVGSLATQLGGTSLGQGSGFSHNIVLTGANSGISVTATSSPGSYYVAVNGVISGAGTLNKFSKGALVISNGNNTYTGGTNIIDGTLVVANQYTPGNWSSMPSATSTGPVNVTVGSYYDISQKATVVGKGVLSSAPNNGGNVYGSIGGMVNLNGGVIDPGGTNKAGTMAMYGLRTGFGSINFDVGATQDLIYTGPGGLSLLGGAFNINQASPANGTYKLIDYSAGALAGDPGTIQLTGATGKFVTLTNDTADKWITLNVANIAQKQYWKGTTNNAWDIGATANWDSAVNTTYQDGNQVVFDDTGTNTNISIASGTTVQPQAILVNSNTQQYTLGGPGSIGGATSITKQGTSTLTMTGNNSFTGNVFIYKGQVSTNSLAAGGPLGSGSMIAFGDPTAAAYDIIQAPSSYNYSGSPGSTSSNNLATALYPNAWLTYTGGNTTTNRLFLVNPAGGTLDLKGTTLDMNGAANLSGSGYLFVVNSAYNTGSNSSVSRLILRGDNSNFKGVLVIAPPEANVGTGNPVTTPQSLGLLTLMTPQSVPGGIIDLLGTPGFDNNEVPNGMGGGHMHPAWAAAVIEIGGDLSPGTPYDFAVPLLRNYYNASNANVNANRFLGSVGQLRLLGSNNNSSVGFAAIGATRVVNIPRYTGSSYTNPGAPVYGTTLLSKTGSLPNGGGDGWVFGSPNADNMVVMMNGIDFNNAAPRYLRTIRGTGQVPEVMFTGLLNNAGNAITIVQTGSMVINNTGAAGVWANGTMGTTSPINFTSGGLMVGADDLATAGVASPLGNNNTPLTIGTTVGNMGATNYNYGPGSINTGLYTYGQNLGITPTPSITISRSLIMGTGGTGTMSIGGFTADHTAYNGQINLNGVNTWLAAAPGSQVDFNGGIYNSGVLHIGPAYVGGTGTGGILVGRTSANGGSGVVVFTAVNTYASGTQIDDGGVLMVNNPLSSGGSGTGTGQVSVNSGGILGGTGLIGSSTQVTPGGVLAPHGIGSTPNTLNFDTTLTFVAPGGGKSAVLNPLITPFGADQVVVNQLLVDNGMVVKPSYSPDFVPNPNATIPLILINNGVGAGISSSQANPVFSNANDARFAPAAVGGLSYDLTTDPSHPVLNLALDWASPMVNWTGGTDNVWEVPATSRHNWFGGEYANPNRVMFANTDPNSVAVANTAINLTTNVTPLDIQFNNSAVNYTINSSNGSKMVDPTITNPADNTQTQAHVWITKDGTGKVTINNHNLLTGGTAIKNGTLSVAFSDSLPSGGITLGNGTLEVQNGYSDSRAYTLTGNGGVTVDAGMQTINGQISGSGSLTVNGPGTLAITNAGNSYAGGTIINSGTVQVSASGQLGTGPMTIDAATLQVTGNVTSPRNVTLGGAATISVSPTMVYRNGGVVSGSGSLAINGGGTVDLAGANTYAGPTNVSAGTLNVSNAFGSATGNAAVNMGAGTTLSGTGTIAGTVNMTAGAINPGTSATPGILTVGGLNADANSSMNFRIGSLSDRVNVTGNNTFTINGGTGTGTILNVTPAAGMTPGVVYTLIDYTGTPLTSTQFGTFRFNLPGTSGLTFTTRNDTAATAVDVEVGSSAPQLKWAASGTSGSWDFGTTNWATVPPTTAQKYTNPNQVLFDDSAAAATVNLTANVSPQFVIVNNSAKDYTFVSAPGMITGPTGLEKIGTRTLEVQGDQTFTGALSVRQGIFKTAKITNAGIPSPLGAGSAVYVGGPDTTGTLRYTSTTPAVSNRMFTFGQAGGTILADQPSVDGNGNPVPTLRITGPVYGGSMSKAGGGWLRVTGATSLLNEAGTVNGGKLEFANTAGNNIVGYFNVTGGILSAPQNALGSAEVRIGSSGTLNLYGSPRYAPNSLALDLWSDPSTANNNTNSQLPNFMPANIMNYIASLGTPATSVTTPTSGSAYGLHWDNSAGASTAAFGSVGFSNTTNYVARFSGLVNAAVPGTYSFFTRSDDGSMLYIDGQLVVNNNYFQGMTTRGGAIKLTPGTHTIQAYYYQGTGGQGFDAYWTTPGGPSQVDIPVSALSVNPVASYANNRVWVQSDSSKTLDVSGILQAQIGTNLPAGTAALQIESGHGITVANDTAGGAVSFASTLFNGGGSYYIDTQAGTGLGSLMSNGGIAYNVDVNSNVYGKGYSGDVIVDGAASVPQAAGSSFHVWAGRLVAMGSTAAGATNPLGGTSVILENGTTFALGSSTVGANPTAVFDDAVTLVGNGTIQHLTAGATSTLGSAANGISIPANSTLTFDIQAGTLNVAGPVNSGAGASINKINAGTVVVNSVAVPLTISGGTVQVGTNDGYALKTMPTIAAGGTFDASSYKQTLTGNQVLNDGAILNAASGATQGAAGYFDLTGSLTVANGNATGTPAQITSSGTGAVPGYLNFNNSANKTIITNNDLAISGGLANSSGAIVKQGPNTLTLSGNNSALLSGAINVQQGTLAVTGQGALGNAGVTLNTGTAMVLNSGAKYIPGLWEARLNTGSNDQTSTPRTDFSNWNNYTLGVRPGPLQGYTNFISANNPLTWNNNQTWVYKGQFFVPNNNGNGTGTFSFAEDIDDNVLLKIDGNQYINDGSWNTNTTTGAVTLSSGWHDIEFRFGNGTGGGGTAGQQNWQVWWGFGMNDTLPVPTSTLLPVQSNYPAVVDNGSMNVFRVLAPYSGSYMGNPNNTVTVAGSASIDLSATDLGTVSALGNLVRGAGDKLSVNGASRQLNFTGLQLNAPGTVGFGGTGNTLVGAIAAHPAGAYHIQKTDSGSLIFNSPANDLTGIDFDVQGGRLVAVAVNPGAGVVSPLGSAAVGLNNNGAILTLANSDFVNPATFSNPVTVSAPTGAAIEHVGITSDVFSGTVALNQGMEARVRAGQLTMNGVLAGNGQFVKSGAGTLVLDGTSPNSLAGGTVVNDGLLLMNKAGSVNALTVNTGTARLTNANAITAGSNLTMTGGTLDINGYTPAFGTANLKGGTIVGAAGSFAPASITANTPGAATNIQAKFTSTGFTVDSGALTLGNSSSTNANAVSGTITVQNGGMLGVYGGSSTTGSPSNPIGTATVNLNGGTAGATLNLSGVNNSGASPYGLLAQFETFTSNPDNSKYNTLTNFNNYFNGYAVNLTANTGRGSLVGGDYSNNNYGSSANAINGFARLGYTVTQTFQTRFTGKVLLQPGTTTFYTGSDDGSVMWLNNADTPVVNNNYYQGHTVRTGTFNNTNTVPTWYDITVGFYQGGGGYGLSFGVWTGQPNPTDGTPFANGILAAPGVALTNTVNATGNAAIVFSGGTVGGKVGTLNVGTSSGPTTLSVSGGNFTADNVALNGNSTFYAASDGGIFLPSASTTGINFNTYNLTKTGPGLLLVQGTATGGASSAITIVDGTVQVNSADALGSGGFTNGRTGVINPAGSVGLGMLDVQGANTKLAGLTVNTLGTLQISNGAQDSGTPGASLPANPILGTFQMNDQDTQTSFPTVSMGDGSTFNYIQSATRTYRSPITVTGRTYLTKSSGNDLNIDGAITASGAANTGSFWVNNANGGTIYFHNSVGVGSSGLFAVENGNVTLQGNGVINAAYSSPNGGTVKVFSGTLTADDTAGNANRFSDLPNRPVILQGGTLRHLGPNTTTSGAQTSETIGKVQVYGQGTLAANIASTTGTSNNVSALVINSLVRPNFSTPGFTLNGATTQLGSGMPSLGAGAVVNFAGDNIASSDGTTRGVVMVNDINNNGPTATNGILGGWATVGNDFASYGYDSVSNNNAVKPLDNSLTIPLDGILDGSAGITGTENVKYSFSGTRALAGGNNIVKVNTMNLNLTGGSTLDLGGHTLKVASGGFLISGSSQSLTIQNGILTAGGTTTGGYADAANGELTFWMNAGGSLSHVTAQITDNSAGPVAVVIAGGGQIEIQNVANSFTGGVFIGAGGGSGGFFRIAATSNNKAADTIGNNSIYFLSNTTLQVRSNGSGSNALLGNGWGNNKIYMYSDGTINVDRWDANSGNMVPFSDLTMDNRRTLTTSSGNSYTVQLNNVFLKGDATFNTTCDTYLAGGLNGAGGTLGSTITKTGGSRLVLNAASGGATMNNSEVIVSQGILDMRNADALDDGTGNPVPTYVMAGATLALPTSGTMNASRINFRPGSTLRITGGANSTVTNLMPVSTVEVTGDSTFNGAVVANNGTFRNTTGLTYGGAINFLGIGNIDTSSGDLTLTAPITGSAVSINKVGSGNNRLFLNGANSTYGGGTTVSTNFLVANATGALGTGPINIISGAGLELRATASANNDVNVTSGQVLYAANNAAGGHVINATSSNINSVSQINIFPNVTDFGNDSFNLSAYAVLAADTARMRLLDGRINAAPNAVLAFQDAPGYTPTSFAPHSIFMGLANDVAPTVVVGGTTPWRGISTDRAQAATSGSMVRQMWGGNIILDNTANTATDGTLAPTVELMAMGGQDLRLAGVNFSSLDPSKAPAQVNIVGRSGSDTTGAYSSNRVTLLGTSQFQGIPDYSGVSAFYITNGAILEAGGYGYAQGHETGGPGTGAKIEAGPGGVLDIGGAANGMALNGPVQLDSGASQGATGGYLLLNDAQNINGTGFITAQPNSVLRIEGQTAALQNKFGNGIFTQPGNLKASSAIPGIGFIARMSLNDISYLNQLSPSAVFEVQGGDRSQDNAGLPFLKYNTTTYGPGNAWTAPGGILTNDGGSKSYVSSGTAGFTDANFIGTTAAGAAGFAASGGTNFNIKADVNTSKQLVIGSLQSIDGLNKTGSVQFWGKAQDNGTVGVGGIFHAPSLNWLNGNLGFSSWNTTINSDIVVPAGQGSVLYIGANGGADGLCFVSNRLVGANVAGTLGSVTPLAPHIFINGNSSATSRVEIGFRAGSGTGDAPTQADGRVHVTQPFILNGDVSSGDKRKFWIGRSQGTGNLNVTLDDITMNDGSSIGVSYGTVASNVRFSLKLAGATETGVQNATFDLQNVSLATGNNSSTFNIGRTTEGNLNTNVWGTIAAGVTLVNVKGQVFFQPGSLLNGVVDAAHAPSGGDSWVQIHNGQDGNPANYMPYVSTSRIILGRSVAANGSEDMDAYVSEPTSGTTGYVNILGTRVDVVQGGGSTSTNSDDDAVIRASLNGSAGTARGAVVYNEVHLGNGTLSGNNMGLQMVDQSGETLVANLVLDTPAGGATSQVRTGSNAGNAYVGSVADMSSGGTNKLQVGYANSTNQIKLAGQIGVAGKGNGSAYVRVDGNGSTNASTVYLNGPVVVASQTLAPGFSLNTGSTLEINGGNVTTVQWNGAAPTTAGAFKLTSGTFNIGSNTNIGTASLAVTGGTFTGTGTVGGAATVSGGTLAPASSGAITFANGLAMSAGNYLFKPTQNSTTAGYGLLGLTGGNLALSGTAGVSFDLSGVTTTNPFWQQFEEWKIIGLSGSATNTGNTKFVAPTQTVGSWKFVTRSDMTGVYLDLIYGGLSQWAPDVALGSWGANTNWSDGNVPNAVGATANLLGAGTGDLGLKTAANAPTHITLDANRTVGALTFNNTVHATTGTDLVNSYVIDSGTGSNTLTIDNGASAAGINVNAGSDAITAPVVINSNANVAIAAGSTLTAGTVTVNGGKALNLNPTSGTGALAVTTLNLGAGSSFNYTAGAANIGGINTTGNNAAINVGNSQTLNTAVTVAAGTSAIGNANVTNGTLNLSSLTLADNVASFEIRNGKVVASNGVNGVAIAPTGGIKVTGGEFNASGAVTAPVNVSGGTFSGTSTVAGKITASGGTIVAGNGTPGVLTAQAGLDLSGGGAFLFKPNALSTSSGFGTINLTGGALTLGGTSSVTLDFSTLAASNLQPQGGDPFWASAHSWKLIDVPGAAYNSTTFATITGGSAYTGWKFASHVGTGADAGDVFLDWQTLTNEWINAAGGSWQTASDWSGGVPTGPATTGDANFWGKNASAGTVTVTLDGACTASNVSFDPAKNGTSATSYALATGTGGSLHLNNGGGASNVAVSVASGAHSITAPVMIESNTDVTITSAAAGPQLTLGAVTVNSGKALTQTGGTMAMGALAMADATSSFEVISGQAKADSVTGGSVKVDSGAKMALTQKGAAGTKGVASTVANLTLAGTAQFDLANNSVTASGLSVAQAYALVKSGYNAGAWNGSGIVTSSSTSLTTIGVTASGSGSLIKYTYKGDVNNDGVVNAADFNIMSLGYYNGGTDWAHGDVNYDGVVNAADFNMASLSYYNQGGALTMSTPHNNVVVPEPTTMGLLAVGALGLLKRRRRSHKA